MQPSLGPILRTKLHRPPLSKDLVSRGRLFAGMGRAFDVPMTFVSAPAGYGKSVLAAQWADLQDVPTAWLSLDHEDSDLRLFLRYLLAAIESVVPNACQDCRGRVRERELAPVLELAADLINGLDAVEDEFVLVLDDYHCVDRTSEVHELMGRLLEHPPQGVHLVLLTRSDPPLALASLRASRRMNEVRLHDLQFTDPEMVEFLATTTGVVPSTKGLARLQEGVEGWAVGLRLVSLNLSRAGDDAEEVLENLRGGVRGTEEYLLREVLDRQAPALRDHLLRASVPKRFCADLLEALAPSSQDGPSEPSGRDAVALLQEENLFVIPLDSRGKWFRFHHLFQDLLRTELLHLRGSKEVAALHSRASVWLARHGLIEEAIDNALAANDAEQAGRLIEEHRIAALDGDRWFDLDRWLQKLPERLIARRPALLLTRAHVLNTHLRIDAIPPILDEVDSKLECSGDDGHAEALRGEVDFLRGSIAWMLGAGQEAVDHLGSAIRRIPPEHEMLRGEAELHFAMARQLVGEGEPARRAVEGMLLDPGSIHPARKTRLVSVSVFLDILAGDLVGALDAVPLLVQASQEPPGFVGARAWSIYLTGLIQYFRGELSDAVRAFEGAVELRYELGTGTALDAMAGLAFSQELEAQQSLRPREDTDLTVQLAFDYVRRRPDPAALAGADSIRAHLSVLRGEPDFSALHRPPPEVGQSPLLFWLEVPMVTHCRLLLAEGSSASFDRAEDTLHFLSEHCEAQFNRRQTIEILPLLALAHWRKGRKEEALQALGRAVSQAAPGGWIRPFLEPGGELVDLLQGLSLDGAEAELARRAVEASRATTLSGLGASGTAASGPPTGPSNEVPLANPAEPSDGRAAGTDDLTNRELDVLELLARRLQNKEIAARLSVSTHTVNDHLKHIYDKLGVNNRRQAASRAVKMGLFPNE